jgi:hypothetical protein
MRAGKTEAEALAEKSAWERDALARNGWYAEIVGDADSPTGFSAHTHGLERGWGHPDFEVVLRIPGDLAYDILATLAKRVKAGERFLAGARVGDVIEHYDVLLVAAREDTRDVLRVILPDKEGRLDGTMAAPYNLQFGGRN